ncbi:hypothetical protein ACH4OW_29230 [Streptomyces sp. NPDC017056]|uniref:hypothetical protein n=1 Tax=Streptomyces sp. NPDC017056 TaxID=3364973 RepID=UPI003795314F
MTPTVETSALQQAISDLERQLPELTAREETLRNELREVEQRLASAQQALQHLRVLTGAVPPGPATAPEHEVQPEPVGEAPAEASQPLAEPEASAPAAEAATTVPQPRTATKSTGTTRQAAPAGKKPATDKGKAASKKPRSSQAAAKKKTAAGSRATASAADELTKAASPLLSAALTILQKHGAPMRPAEINTELGREDTAGQRESLRNTLERAVKAGLLKRPGRGQYAA